MPFTQSGLLLLPSLMSQCSPHLSSGVAPIRSYLVHGGLLGAEWFADAALELSCIQEHFLHLVGGESKGAQDALRASETGAAFNTGFKPRIAQHLPHFPANSP